MTEINGKVYYEKHEYYALLEKYEELEKKYNSLITDYDILESKNNSLESEVSKHYDVSYAKESSVLAEVEASDTIKRNTSCNKCYLKNECKDYDKDGYCSKFTYHEYGYDNYCSIAYDLRISCCDCKHYKEEDDYCTKRGVKVWGDEFCYLFEELNKE
jgi:hypothetical protein